MPKLVMMAMDFLLLFFDAVKVAGRKRCAGFARAGADPAFVDHPAAEGGLVHLHPKDGFVDIRSARSVNSGGAATSGA